MTNAISCDHLSGSTVIITGGSQGIGAAAASFIAEKGANSVLIARNKQRLDLVVDHIKRSGGNALGITGDVACYESLTGAVDAAIREFGSVDALVNNAGVIDPIARLADSDPDKWSSIVDVNLKGVYNGIRAVLPHMLRTGGGTIINISSGAATGAMEGWSHYCATKAAVLSLTRCVHREYGDQGIRSIGLSPGTVATDMQLTIRDSGVNPVSELSWSAHIPADWVAQAIAYLLSGEADDLCGGDFSLKNDEGRTRVQLPPLAEVR